MKIEGLRKGNYVFYHKIHKVIGMFETMEISKPDILIHPLEEGSIIRFQGEYNDINPLKITPEILSKSYYEKDGERVIFERSRNHFFIKCDIEMLSIIFWEKTMSNPEYYLFGEKITIEGFHHLQNILYELFRIELKLEL